MDRGRGEVLQVDGLEEGHCCLGTLGWGRVSDLLVV